MTPTEGYWDEIASTASFTHPVNTEWIKEHCDASLPVLEFGCGYGRLVPQLEAIGFHQIRGVDPSPAMIARARREQPHADFAVLEGSRTPFRSSTFGLVTLIAVLTCVSETADQAKILSEIRRILQPGGYLYISDFLLQEDERNLRRYRLFRERGFDHGTFEIDDGKAVMRHHTRHYLDAQLSGFDRLEEDSFRLHTMKGHEATGIRMLLRKK